jgi:nicotinate phosphoribosyltransferase
LKPALRDGKLMSEPETLSTIRERAATGLERLHPSVRRFVNPHEYPVGMDVGLHELRDRMIREARPVLVEAAR